MQDHTPLTTTNFEGVLDRGVPVDVPFKNLLDGLNLKFDDGQFETREGSLLDTTLSGILRRAEYRPEGQAPRKIILATGGNFYDATISTSIPILTIAAATDFSGITINDKYYITPHNGEVGLPGESVYVYDGTSVRVAAGIAPSTTPAAANSGTAGSIEIGKHLFRVAFETSTGFITGLSPAVLLDAPGAQKAVISSIPTGPAGTVNRYIFATKVLLNYNGDTENQEYFFVPNGLVSGNVSTSQEIDFFDADLFESADYLLDTLPTIPAGVGLGVYKGQMVVWGENSNPDYLRVSEVGEPENFSAIEGFLRVGPDGAGGIRNCAEYRGQLLICKDNRTYSTSATGDRAIYWAVDDVDLGKGTTSHGIGVVLATEGKNTEDICIIATRGGLYGFTGTYNDAMFLSWKINNIWNRITKSAFHTIEVCLDTELERIYVAVPLDGSVIPNAVLYGDYSSAYTAKDIRWCLWTFPISPRTIMVSVNNITKQTVFLYGSTNDYRLVQGELNDFGNAINNFARFAYAQTGYAGQQNHYAGIRLIAKGVGTVAITVYTMNDARNITPPAYTLSNNPEFYFVRKFNFVTEKASVKIALNAIGAWMRVNSYTLFAKPFWTDRPNE